MRREHGTARSITRSPSLPFGRQLALALSSPDVFARLVILWLFQWGHDFRPEYCKLGILKRQFSHVPVLAVTATCTDFIRDDVRQTNGGGGVV